MTTKDEALRMALEALELYQSKSSVQMFDDAAAAIREVLAQPDQEPVAAQHRFRHPQKTMPDWSAWQPCKIKHGRPAWEFDSQGYEVEYRELYTSPPPKPWVGLTQQEQSSVLASVPTVPFEGDWHLALLTAIEAKLKEKNA